MTDILLVAVLLFSFTTATILLNTALNIEPIANDVINQTIEFTQEMNSSLDCAFVGIPLSECSDIYKYSGIGRIEKYKNQLANISEELNNITNDS